MKGKIIKDGEKNQKKKYLLQRNNGAFNYDKNKIAGHCWETDYDFNWDQKKVIHRESRLITRKIK